MTHTDAQILQHMATWPKAFAPTSACTFRAQAADFIVDEALSFEPSGEGQHAYLRIRKTNLNTAWVGRQLAKLANTQSRNVGHAGLKDRNAVTTQWFSVDLRGKPAPDWSKLNSYCRDGESIEVLAATYGDRKLKQGAVAANHFTITLRDCTDADDILRCAESAKIGIPNYFGEQRFGRGGGNINAALAWFAGEDSSAPHDMMISAARSFIFNEQLAQMVNDGSWNQVAAHPHFSLRDSKSIFTAEGEATTELQSRLDTGDIHPAMPLNRGEVPDISDDFASDITTKLAAGLKEIRLSEEFRPLRILPYALSAERHLNDVIVKFHLRSGAYATSVLSEIAKSLLIQEKPPAPN